MKCSKDFSLKVQNSAPVPTAYWELEEASGNRVDSVQGISLAFSGAGPATIFYQAPGIIGKALGMQNPVIFVEYMIQNSIPLAIGVAGWSLTCWVKFNTPATVSYVTVGWRGAVTFNEFRFKISTVAGNPFMGVFVTDDSFNDYTNDSVAPLTTGVWHHLAMTYSAAGLLTIYLDDAVVVSTNPGLSMTSDVSGNFLIVAAGPLAPETFDCTMDEVGLWLTKALTATDIDALYNAGAGARPPFS